MREAERLPTAESNTAATVNSAPSVVLAPAGVSARELVEEFCGGMLDGHKFKGYLPGGASGGILPESMSDLPLDFGTLEQYGCFVGSHAVVILSDKDNYDLYKLYRMYAPDSKMSFTTWRELRQVILIRSDVLAVDKGQSVYNPTNLT